MHAKAKKRVTIREHCESLLQASIFTHARLNSSKSASRCKDLLPVAIKGVVTVKGGLLDKISFLFL